MTGIIIVAVILIFVLAGIQVKKQKKAKNSAEDILGSTNFNIDRMIPINEFSAFYVDDSTKQIAISQNGNIKTYSYNDLLDFEMKEDGETVTSGKGAATIAGAVTFGLVGALVGASGKRNSKTVCDRLDVILHINNLATPNLKLSFLTSKAKKESFAYKTAIANAESLVSALRYIKNQ